MAEQSERRRILDMLAAGQINVDEAAELLNAVEVAGAEEPGMSGDVRRHRAVVKALQGAGRQGHGKIARSLRIVVDATTGEKSGRGRVTVTVPLALAKFAGKLIPEEVRTRLEDEGIELTDLLQALDQELPEGRLVDIDTTAAEDEGKRARIIVEVA